jgi:hypothetical protein
MLHHKYTTATQVVVVVVVVVVGMYSLEDGRRWRTHQFSPHT